MNILPFSRSVEDLSHTQHGEKVTQQRARSASPIKNRRHREQGPFDLLSTMFPSESDLRSIASSTNTLSPDRLRALSKSPISRKIHITSPENSKYIIPIPLTLNLPPKLGKKGSTSNNKPGANKFDKQQERLVYNGYSYELMDDSFGQDLAQTYLEDSKSSSIIALDIPSPSRTGPPPVLRNQKKGKTLSWFPTTNSDNLSTIDETSVRGRSAGNSINSDSRKSNRLTSQIENRSRQPQNGEIHAAKVTYEENINFIATSKTEKNPIQEINNEIFTEKPVSLPIEQFSQDSLVNKHLSVGSNLLPIYDVRKDLKLTEGFGNTNSARILSNNSTISSASLGSGISWNSIQRSLDIAIDSLNDDAKQDFSDKPKLGEIFEEPAKPPIIISEITEAESKEDNFNIEAPSTNNEKTEEDAFFNFPYGIENQGVGKDFVFPNDETNVTNNKNLVSVPAREGSFRSKVSRNSFRSATGQIEIPELNNDLDCISTGQDSGQSEKYSYGHKINPDTCSTGTESERLEPVHSPTKAAKNIARECFGSLYEDSESESDGMSTPVSRTFSRNIKANKTSEKKLPALPPSLSRGPTRNLRHSRHKSMCAIDFVKEAVVPNTPESFCHARSRSLDAEKVLLSGKAKASTDDTNASRLSIIDPPSSKVQYNIDFRESESVDNFPKTLHRVPTNDPTDKASYDKYETINSKSPNNLNSKGALSTLNGHPYRWKFFSGESGSHGRERKASISSTVTKSTGHLSDQSSAFNRKTISTTPSDTDSVVIDLTKDKYDLCLVHRNNSTSSYKSVTERMKDGKKVEVVLVDDNDNLGSSDDLESIYSKYAKDKWVFRTDSLSTTSSSSSTRSFESRSTDKFKASSYAAIPTRTNSSGLKLATIRNHETSSNHIRSKNLGVDKTHVIGSTLLRQTLKQGPSLNHKIDGREGRYYDYALDNNYTFNSFMKSQSNL